MSSNGRSDNAQEIAIYNFDAIEQSKLWLQLGPAEATRTLISVARTALLLQKKIVIDRNQLLEGIFFVAVSPERLAWHLGIDPAAPLPVVVQLLPTPCASKLGGTSWRRTQPVNVDRSLANEIWGNYYDVRNDTNRVSSVLIALTQNYQKHDKPKLSSAARIAGEDWHNPDPILVPKYLCTPMEVAAARTISADGRQAWIDAMLSGKVAVRSGKNLGENPMGKEPFEKPSSMSEMDNMATQVYDALSNVKRRPKLPRRLCKKANGPQEWPRVTQRSLVTRWLDGEKVNDLDPPELPFELRTDNYATHRQCALTWWTHAYYRAISSRDGLQLLTIYNCLPTPSNDDGAKSLEIELTWGVRLPKQSARSRLSRVFSRGTKFRVGNDHGNASPKDTVKAPRTLPVDGNIVDRLRNFTPDQYSRLRTSNAFSVSDVSADIVTRKLFDIVVAIDDISGEQTNRSTRRKRIVGRIALYLPLATVLVLDDNDVLDLSGLGWGIGAVIVGLFLAVPWSDINALKRISGSSLQSTLRLLS